MAGQFEPFLSLGQSLLHQGEFWMTTPGQDTEKHVHAWLLSDRLVLAEALKKQRADLAFAHRETIFLGSSAILASTDTAGQAANTFKVYVSGKREIGLRARDHYSFMKWRTILKKQ
ncbi:hypothetical protein SYNPS1DRAFT_23647 [Syncephalis pseudoplumigaleata]|nr:hypothetical protein SYNPS1DRAFT_23647 [Syncephalis pseudoplumigaleata]|eukprot:RKP24258.1 hypothetical protein SYNPS1DRAFT_23647 [Syncephalis pseudoplumigaleata]